MLVGSNVSRLTTENVFHRLAMVDAASAAMPSVMTAIASSVHTVERTVRILVHSARTSPEVRWGRVVASVLDQTVAEEVFIAIYFPFVVAVAPSRRWPWYSTLSRVISMKASSRDADWGESS